MSRKIPGQVNKSLTCLIKTVTAPQLTPRFEPVYRPKIHEWRGGWAPLRKDPRPLSKIYTGSSFFQSSPRDLWLFTSVTAHWGKGNNQTFWGLPDTGSGLALIPGDSKHHCVLSVRLGTNGGRVINGVLAQAHLTEGPVGPQIHPVVISPVLECLTGVDIFSNWQNPHIDEEWIVRKRD